MASVDLYKYEYYQLHVMEIYESEIIVCLKRGYDIYYHLVFMIDINDKSYNRVEKYISSSVTVDILSKDRLDEEYHDKNIHSITPSVLNFTVKDIIYVSDIFKNVKYNVINHDTSNMKLVTTDDDISNMKLITKSNTYIVGESYALTNVTFFNSLRDCLLI